MQLRYRQLGCWSGDSTVPADDTTLPFKKRDLGTSRWQLGLNATPDLRAGGRGQPDVLLQSPTAVHGIFRTREFPIELAKGAKAEHLSQIEI